MEEEQRLLEAEVTALTKALQTAEANEQRARAALFVPESIAWFTLAIFLLGGVVMGFYCLWKTATASGRGTYCYITHEPNGQPYAVAADTDWRLDPEYARADSAEAAMEIMTKLPLCHALVLQAQPMSQDQTP